VSGAFVSMEKLRVAADPSAVPSSLTATTANVCGPSARGAVV
jgi:hypothetical protein